MLFAISSRTPSMYCLELRSCSIVFGSSSSFVVCSFSFSFDWKSGSTRFDLRIKLWKTMVDTTIFRIVDMLYLASSFTIHHFFPYSKNCFFHWPKWWMTTIKHFSVVFFSAWFWNRFWWYLFPTMPNPSRFHW